MSDLIFSPLLSLVVAQKVVDNYEDFPNANKALSHVFFLGCPPFWNDKVFEYIEEVLKKC